MKTINYCKKNAALIDWKRLLLHHHTTKSTHYKPDLQLLELYNCPDAGLATNIPVHIKFITYLIKHSIV